MSPGTATAHKAHNPAPRTPLPAATFDGTLELSGRAIELDGWRGMVGHNWGSGHADRWIWVHGVGFAEEPLAWLQLALGRVRLAGRMTPWVASGALSLDGHRHRVGGLRRAHVSESARGCTLALAGERRLLVRAEARVPEGSAAAWRYSDPSSDPHGEESPSDSSAHVQHGRDVINCSVAALELAVRLPGAEAWRTLQSPHGGAYELGG